MAACLGQGLSSAPQPASESGLVALRASRAPEARHAVGRAGVRPQAAAARLWVVPGQRQSRSRPDAAAATLAACHCRPPTGRRGLPVARQPEQLRTRLADSGHHDRACRWGLSGLGGHGWS